MNVIAELRINNMTLLVGREALLFGSRGRIKVYSFDEIVRVKENAFAYRTGHNISSPSMVANGRH